MNNIKLNLACPYCGATDLYEIDICNKKGINININTTISEIEENYTKLHARDIKSIFRNKIQTPVAKFIAKNPKSKKISIKVLDKKVVIS